VVAEVELWSRSDATSRRISVEGAYLITAFAHRSMRIVRLFAEFDPLDGSAKYLSAHAGYSLEEQVRREGADKVVYSSIG
jgi:hypothetical protein